jgi:hypothetical protein
VHVHALARLITFEPRLLLVTCPKLAATVLYRASGGAQRLDVRCSSWLCHIEVLGGDSRPVRRLCFVDEEFWGWGVEVVGVL